MSVMKTKIPYKLVSRGPGWATERFMGVCVEGSITMEDRDQLEVLMEIGEDELPEWRLVNDPSYPTPVSILHRCPTNTAWAGDTRVTCLGNWVTFRQGVCCGCELPIPDDMLVLGVFAHWEVIHGYKR
jgi:hypothetical protein